jgi:hypothetical protein
LMLAWVVAAPVVMRAAEAPPRRDGAEAEAPG